MTPPRPSRAAIDTALSVLRVLTTDVRRNGRFTPGASVEINRALRFGRSASHGGEVADCLDEVIAWMEGQ